MASQGTLVIRFIGDLKHFNKTTAALGTRITKLGHSTTTGLTLPIIGVGVAAGKLHKDFEKSMSLIEGLVGASKKDLKSYTDTILRDGPKWGKAPQELADALYFVTSSGFEGAAALRVLKISAKASTAGLGETMTIADLLTSAINAYGKKNLSAAAAADVLSKAVELGKLESEEFADVMGRVMPVASAMGVEFHEASAAMAAMSMSGTDAAEGATQLRGILGSLMKPTVQAEQQLSRMGLSSKGLREQLKNKGLLSVLETLRSKFDGNTAATARVFGNVRALTGVMNMMGANVGSTRNIFKQMQDATGSMDKAFAAAAETSEFKLDKAMAVLKSALIQLGAVIMPMVAQGVSFLADKAMALQPLWDGLSAGAKKFIVMALGIAAAVGPVLIVVGKLVSLVAMAATPWGLAVTAGIALVAMFAKMKAGSGSAAQMLERVKNAFTNSGMIDALKKTGASVMAFVRAVLPSLQKVGRDIAAVLVPALADLAGFVRDKVLPAIQAMLPVLAPVFRFIIATIGGAVVGAIKGAIQAVKGVVDVVAGVFQLVNALIHGQWGKAWHALVRIVKGVINVVVGALKVWFNIGILNVFRRGIVALLSGWRGLWKGIRSVAVKAWDGLTKLMTGAMRLLARLFVGAIRGYLNMWKNLFTGLFRLAQLGWKGLRSAFGGALAAVRTVLATMVQRMQKAWGAFWNFFRGIGTKLINFVRSTIPEAFRRAVNGISSLWGRLREAARKPVSFIVNTVYMDGIRRVVNAIPGVPDLPSVRFAKGGGVFGGTRGKDSVNALLMPGEHVWTAEEVRKLGGHGAVEALRDAVRQHGKLPQLMATGGAVTPAAGSWNRHSGYPWARWAGDINVPGSGDYGNPVRAWKAGVVAAVNHWTTSYGNHIRINHGAERTLYAHLSRTFVHAGQAVRAGQLIGRVGSTGNSSGPHLHFEIAGGSGPIQKGSGKAKPSPFLKAAKLLKDMVGKAGGWLKRITDLGPWGPMLKPLAAHIISGGRRYAASKIPGLGTLMKLSPVGSLVSKLFDKGGILAAGGLAANMSGRPERVLDPRTTANFEVLAGALNSIASGGGPRGHDALAEQLARVADQLEKQAQNGRPVHLEQKFPVSADPTAAASAAADRIVAALGG